MKISKLFHWLYAILMLMPIFAIGVSCLYVIFNKNAKDSYSGETTYDITYKYQSNVVNTNNDIIVGNIYHISNLTAGDFSDNSPDYIYNFDFTLIHGNFTIINGTIDEVYLGDTTFYVLTNYTTQDGGQVINLGTSTAIESYTYCDSITFSSDAVIQIVEFNVSGNKYDLFTYTDYNEIESVNIDNSGTLDNVFYYSIDQLKNNSLFNWSRNSFLAQPITYITDLFGMDNDNIVIYLLSYWLDISIIWLVFDLVMYVPLLVHRWVDKGVLE